MPPLSARVGAALLRAGLDRDASPWLDQAAQAGVEGAELDLGRVALARGALDEAEQLARRAVARGVGAAGLLVLVDVLKASGREGEAAEALAAAATWRGHDANLLRAAVRVTPLSDPSSLERHADVLERRVPGDGAAEAARAWACLVRGDLAPARALDGANGEPRAQLVRAALALCEERPPDALRALDALGASPGLSPPDVREAERLRRDALRALWRGPHGEVDLAAAIDAVARFAAERGLDATERRAAALRDELDRPLLLAVLGEFNAGKSTLINAFVGADVAPTGILPTTATLNVLRGGAERRVRVVRTDGTTREGGYEELESLLADAEGDEGVSEASSAPAIDRVEIVLPSETLERVWVLDTPGTNALDEAHQQLALEAVRRADAALWLFDAGQAGKHTEARMLDELSASGRVVVPVLNKIDRLRPGDVAEVLAVLSEALASLPEVVPISARAALRARLADDPEGLEASGFDRLTARLERDVFARSRSLKRAACGRRLLGILDGALETEAQAAAGQDARIARLAALASPLASISVGFDDTLDEVLGALERARDAAFDEAAAEVLSFVRPRAHRFERHGADPEDRAFLADVLDQRLGAALDACDAALQARASTSFARVLEGAGFEPAEIDRRVAAAVGAPVAAFRGYQRGMLAGGALRRFFDEVLPHATLEHASIALALGAARADARQELRPTLSEGLHDSAGGPRGGTHGGRDGGAGRPRYPVDPDLRPPARPARGAGRAGRRGYPDTGTVSRCRRFGRLPENNGGMKKGPVLCIARFHQASRGLYSPQSNASQTRP